MTGAEERLLLADYLSTCARLAAGFEDTIRLVARLLPADAATIDDLPSLDTTLLLAFMKRFEQFEDALGRTLRAIARAMELGRIERLTAVDVARRAHKLGIIDDEGIWADAVRTRNALAHEYPLDRAKRAAQLNRAWDTRTTLTLTWAAIERFVAEEGLLT